MSFESQYHDFVEGVFCDGVGKLFLVERCFSSLWIELILPRLQA